MANLLRFLVELATDGDARNRYRDDPHGVLEPFATATPGGLTGEDVVAAARVAAGQVAADGVPPDVDALTAGRPEHDETPLDAAVRQILVWCDAAEAVDPAESSDETMTAPSAEPERTASIGGGPLPAAPPGADRHLWAIAGTGPSRAVSIDPEHPAVADSRPAALSSVPDPEDGFEFSALELVVLPRGIPEADIEPGATATVVSVRRAPEPAYEIEVSGPDGAQRFLGVVPRDAVDRP